MAAVANPCRRQIRPVSIGGSDRYRPIIDPRLDGNARPWPFRRVGPAIDQNLVPFDTQQIDVASDGDGGRVSSCMGLPRL